MKIATPFNHHVPKGMRANLEWRVKVSERIMTDPAYAEVIHDACAKDPLFFINGFCWTYDPRSALPRLPFILYKFQEEAMIELLNAIGNHDLLVEKSRDMGASWMCIAAIFWFWLFAKNQSFLFVSRVEEYVDKPGNPKSMFWKFDFLVNGIPIWLRPVTYNEAQCRRKLHAENPENGSVVDGESTTGNVARGDRRTAILLDEFAAVEEGHRVLSSTRDATNCRLFNSTPNGTANAFYDIRETGIKKLRLHWSQHPLKSVGLYATGRNGLLDILDKDNYLPDYKPILDGKVRSQWYDNECKRATTKREIAQELDIDYQGSGAAYFDKEKVQQLMRLNARPPLLVGDLDYDDATGEPLQFREDSAGRLRLWCQLSGDGKPPKDHKIVLGVDVAAGTGASNSCGVAWDVVTCGKIAEYVNPYIRPESFAKQMVALARWFGKPLIIWESGGPGRQFGSKVIELGYSDIYFRKREEALSNKTTDIPGVAQTRETFALIIGAYRDGVEKGTALNTSKEALEECMEYIYGPNGGPIHARASDKDDPSGARLNHGDRVVADALAWKGIMERASRPKQETPTIPIGCLMWRQKRRKDAEQLQNRELTAGWR